MLDYETRSQGVLCRHLNKEDPLLRVLGVMKEVDKLTSIIAEPSKNSLWIYITWVNKYSLIIIKVQSLGKEFLY